MKKPFTKEEVIVSGLLVKAHNAFVKLPKGHPSDINEWVISIHRMQNILMSRVVTRDYKEIFTQSEKPKKFDKNTIN